MHRSQVCCWSFEVGTTGSGNSRFPGDVSPAAASCRDPDTGLCGRRRHGCVGTRCEEGCQYADDHESFAEGGLSMQHDEARRGEEHTPPHHGLDLEALIVAGRTPDGDRFAARS